MKTAAVAAVLLLAACGSEPAAVAPDTGETAVAAAQKAAVDDTDAALRDARVNGT